MTRDHRLIREFYQFFKADLVDKNHSGFHHQLSVPAEPRVLHINSRAVGCIELKKPEGSVNGFVELYYFYIYPHCAKKGFGSQIMQYLCELADKLNVEIDLEAIPLTGLETIIGSSDLHRFYKKFNFQPSQLAGSKFMTRLPNVKEKG